MWRFRTSSVTAPETRRSEAAIREVRGPPGPFLMPAKWIAVLTSCEYALHMRIHSGASSSRAHNQITAKSLWLGAEQRTESLSPPKDAAMLRCCSEAPLHLSGPHCFPPSARPCRHGQKAQALTAPSAPGRLAPPLRPAQLRLAVLGPPSGSLTGTTSSVTFFQEATTSLAPLLWTEAVSCGIRLDRRRFLATRE